MGGRSLALVLALVSPLPALAQDAPAADDEAGGEVTKDPHAAKKWLAAGKELVSRGDRLARAKKHEDAKTQWTNAATAFQNAIAAGDDPNVYADLAAVEEKLGKLDAAATHYRTLIGTTSGVRADVMKRAKARFDDLTMEVGQVTLIVKPEGTAISIGGAEVGKTPMTAPLILMPGTYTVSFAADGFQPKDVEINVDAGSERERTLELEPIEVNVAAPEPEEPEDKPVVVASHAPSKLPLYVGGGATIGFAAAAVVTGLLARSKHSTFVAPETSTPAREDARTSGKRLAVVSDVALGGAVVAAGFTAYWYFAKYRPAHAKHESEREAKLEVAPWVQFDGGGFAVAGSF